MPVPSAKVIADSITREGQRLTTFEAVFHRFVLAEANTHRVFSRNSASSRAIPVTKMLDRFENEWALPVMWTSEQPGMQGGNELEGIDLDDARTLLTDVHQHTADSLRAYIAAHPDASTRLHKSRLNRLMEWGQYHTAVITATAYDNFFMQRVSTLAEPEIRVVAEAMYDAFLDSDPVELKAGQWHLPYIADEDRTEADQLGLLEHPGDELSLIKISTARVARTSYLTQDGKRDLGEDLGLYDKLTTAAPMHASPLEHVATPESLNAMSVYVRSHVSDATMVLRLPKYGNFLGYHQHRFDVEAAQGYQSFS